MCGYLSLGTTCATCALAHDRLPWLAPAVSTRVWGALGNCSCSTPAFGSVASNHSMALASQAPVWVVCAAAPCTPLLFLAFFFVFLFFYLKSPRVNSSPQPPCCKAAAQGMQLSLRSHMPHIRAQMDAATLSRRTYFMSQKVRPQSLQKAVARFACCNYSAVFISQAFLHTTSSSLAASRTSYSV